MSTEVSKGYIKELTIYDEDVITSRILSNRRARVILVVTFVIFFNCCKLTMFLILLLLYHCMFIFNYVFKYDLYIYIYIYYLKF